MFYYKRCYESDCGNSAPHEDYSGPAKTEKQGKCLAGSRCRKITGTVDNSVDAGDLSGLTHAGNIDVPEHRGAASKEEFSCGEAYDLCVGVGNKYHTYKRCYRKEEAASENNDVLFLYNFEYEESKEGSEAGYDGYCRIKKTCRYLVKLERIGKIGGDPECDSRARDLNDTAYYHIEHEMVEAEELEVSAKSCFFD